MWKRILGTTNSNLSNSGGQCELSLFLCLLFIIPQNPPFLVYPHHIHILHKQKVPIFSVIVLLHFKFIHRLKSFTILHHLPILSLLFFPYIKRKCLRPKMSNKHMRAVLHISGPIKSLLHQRVQKLPGIAEISRLFKLIKLPDRILWAAPSQRKNNTE